MILLKYNKLYYVPKREYPTAEDIIEWEKDNGPIDEIDSTYCPWRVFRFIDEDLATAFRMRFPKKMRIVTTDVDIDCFGRDKILEGLECVFGRIDRADDKFEKHPTGVYFQNIPRDPTTNISTVDHRIANDYGYFKIDFLNVNMYEGIKSEDHLNELLNKEPPWDFFEYEEITEKLFHLKGHSHLLQRHKPKSVEDLAMILAIIRPSKAHLQHAGWDEIRKQVWEKDAADGYQFKRAHGIAYSLAIVVNLNLLIEKMSRES